MRHRRLTIRYGYLPEAAGNTLPWNAHVPMPLARPHWTPPVDFFESADSLFARVEVAGMVEGDFKVSLAGQVLVIEGERRWEGLPDERTCCIAAEIRYGPFRIELNVGSGFEAAQLVARYDRGFLLVELPKNPEATR